MIGNLNIGPCILKSFLKVASQTSSFHLAHLRLTFMHFIHDKGVSVWSLGKLQKTKTLKLPPTNTENILAYQTVLTLNIQNKSKQRCFATILPRSRKSCCPLQWPASVQRPVSAEGSCRMGAAHRGVKWASIVSAGVPPTSAGPRGVGSACRTFHFPWNLQHFGAQTVHGTWQFATRVHLGLVLGFT